jgi:hypothetical protein
MKLARHPFADLKKTMARKMARHLVVDLEWAYEMCLAAESPRSDMRLVFLKQSPLVARLVAGASAYPLDQTRS